MIVEVIENYNDDNLALFSNKFRYSELIGIIDNVDNSILSNQTTITMQKRLVPSLINNDEYDVRFGNAIQKPLNASIGSISSTSFLLNSFTPYFDDDADGNLRIYYISNGSRVYVDETAGTVDYDTGLVHINIFLPTSYDGSSIQINAIPNTKDLVTSRNQILIIEDSDITVSMTNDQS